jgi:hypothetical protein
MGQDSSSRHHLFAAALGRAGWSLRQAWLGYFALGGRCDVVDVEAFLEGLMTIDAYEQDVLAVALNERLHDLYLDGRVPYLHGDDAGSTPLPVAAEVLTELIAQAAHDRTRG